MIGGFCQFDSPFGSFYEQAAHLELHNVIALAVKKTSKAFIVSWSSDWRVTWRSLYTNLPASVLCIRSRSDIRSCFSVSLPILGGASTTCHHTCTSILLWANRRSLLRSLSATIACMCSPHHPPRIQRRKRRKDCTSDSATLSVFAVHILVGQQDGGIKAVEQKEAREQRCTDGPLRVGWKPPGGVDDARHGDDETTPGLEGKLLSKGQLVAVRPIRGVHRLRRQEQGQAETARHEAVDAEDRR
mmetsp:Transcript_24916/g.72057  ORF Transcript_24916/g.72057 Transcript_24916/m.72057 type:complete len:244 (+) Transcript_24916:1710-2441(+)